MYCTGFVRQAVRGSPSHREGGVWWRRGCACQWCSWRWWEACVMMMPVFGVARSGSFQAGKWVGAKLPGRVRISALHVSGCQLAPALAQAQAGAGRWSMRPTHFVGAYIPPHLPVRLLATDIPQKMYDKQRSVVFTQRPWVYPQLSQPHLGVVSSPTSRAMACVAQLPVHMRSSL